jgi:hypothetical protein
LERGIVSLAAAQTSSLSIRHRRVCSATPTRSDDAMQETELPFVGTRHGREQSFRL